MSQAADPDLRNLHLELAGRFAQFRTAERTGAMADFLIAAKGMLNLEAKAQDLAKAKGIDLGTLYARK